MAGHFLQMKIKCIFTILILAVTAMLLCGCFSSPYAEQVVNSNKNTLDNSSGDNNIPTVPTRTLYVSGAVVNDGYITIPQVCDYKTALDIAGVLSSSVLPINIFAPIPSNTDSLLINFCIDDTIYYCVNVNGAYVTSRLSIDGIDDLIVNKLADYIQSNGVISNRSQLKIALGDDYNDNYYKFYIDKSDYAQDS